MKDQFWSILLHPLSLTLAITLISILFVPEFAPRHLINSTVSGRAVKDSRVYFRDMNGDGTLERLTVYPNSIGFASLMMHDSTERLIDQWNFDAPRLDMNNWHIGLTDFDQDNYTEVSILTRIADSAFFNMIEPLDKNGITRKKIYVDSLIPYNNKYQIRTEELFTSTSNGLDKHIYFSINNGFGGYPRNLYSYSLNKNTVTASEYLTNTSYIRDAADIDLDGSDEILLSTVSFDNHAPSLFGNRTDSSSWVTILNHDLSFYLQPFEVPVKFSSTRVLPRSDGEAGFRVFVKTRQDPSIPNTITTNGIKGDTIDIQVINGVNIILKPNLNRNGVLVYDKNTGEMNLLGLENNITTLFKAPNLSLYHQYDLNSDGEMETIGYSFLNNRLDIYNPADKTVTSASWINDPEGTVHIDFVSEKQDKAKVVIQQNGHFDLLEYSRNPMFYWKYPIYAGGFLLIFALVKIIVKGQELREKRERKLETEMAELQLKTIKNQVDPHFVFNAINTISDMTLMDDKLEADRMISEFSKLMRQTLSSSDKIVHSLIEELNYIRTYIKFQQIRFGHSFEFNLEIDEKVSTEQPIPKHLVYTFVENAVKHGLSSKPKNAALVISISKTLTGTLIKVENRGDGVKLNGAKHPKSTGNGMLILDRLLNLYSSRFKKKISYKLVDLVEVDQAVGVIAEIMIPE